MWKGAFPLYSTWLKWKSSHQDYSGLLGRILSKEVLLHYSCSEHDPNSLTATSSLWQKVSWTLTMKNFHYSWHPKSLPKVMEASKIRTPVGAKSSPWDIITKANFLNIKFVPLWIIFRSGRRLPPHLALLSDEAAIHHQGSRGDLKNKLPEGLKRGPQQITGSPAELRWTTGRSTYFVSHWVGRVLRKDFRTTYIAVANPSTSGQGGIGSLERKFFLPILLFAETETK